MTISIKCHGEFYAQDKEHKIIQAFEEVVRAPSLKFFEQTAEKYTGTDDNGKLQFRTSTFINVRGTLKKKLLPMILSLKYQGVFKRVKLVTIDEIVAENNEVLDLPVTLMSIAQLAKLIKSRNIPLDVNSYLNVDELRTDVLEYQEDPATFARNYERKQKKRQEEREFRELNNLMPKAEAEKPKVGRKGISSHVTDSAVQTPPNSGTEQSPF